MDRYLWGTDYPHPEGSWPYPRKQQYETFYGPPEDEAASMLGGYVVEFYGLDQRALAPLVERIDPTKQSFQTEGAPV